MSRYLFFFHPGKSDSAQSSNSCEAVTMAMMTNAASKYKDIISKSYEIKKGSPTIYQLRLTKENIGTLKRMSLGVKNPNKVNKTILLVGETGTGKSTLVNALVNFAMGVKWEDDVWFQIVEDEKKDQSQSQTSDVVVYEIFGLEDKTLPYSLTIIDTPGFGDTEGIEHDEIVSQRLFDLFRSVGGVHKINAVGLVLKATENRLSDRLSYILNSVLSLFGKDLEQNIITLLTHSTGRFPKNALDALKAANIKCARNDRKQPVHFLFDSCQNEDRTEGDTGLKDAYNKAMHEMERFITLLQNYAPQKLETTVDVLNERIRLTACIQNLQERIQCMELKQKEIQQTQEALKQNEEGMKSFEGFTVEVDESYKDKEPIKSGMWGLFFYEGAVTCKVCEENCHYPGCTMSHYPSHCEVMKEGRCTSCTNKCPVADHVKEGYMYVTKTRKVKKTLKDVKKKYEENKAQNEKSQDILESLEKDMETREALKTKTLYEAYDHVVRLDQIALSVVSVSTYVHLDFLIEEMEKKGDTKKAQKLKEMSGRKNKIDIAAIKYLYRKYVSSK
uniref:Septin-type G domain-containing protein n=1 Tax=Gasterosteus aculeatus aculeatus TaxID=481459 RepID=A0AAQ4PD53_GASAC